MRHHYVSTHVISECVTVCSLNQVVCGYVYEHQLTITHTHLIYLNYLCNQCLLPLTLWVRILHRQDVLDTTLCDKACQWRAPCRCLSPRTRVSSTNKTDCHDITEILLKVAFKTITLTLKHTLVCNNCIFCKKLSFIFYSILLFFSNFLSVI